MNNDFKSYLQYKTLHHKFNNSLEGHSIDQMLELFRSEGVTDSDGSKFSEQLINDTLRIQNVCAKITVPLVRRMESRIQILGMSKREFIEIAIISALEEAERITQENGLELPLYDDGAQESDR